MNLGTAPRVLSLVPDECSDTTGGQQYSVTDASELGVFGSSPKDIEYVLLSGFDLEKAAVLAGLNSTSTIPGKREGIVNGSRLMEPESLAAMGIPSWQLAVALPVLGSSSSPVIPVGNVNATL